MSGEHTFSGNLRIPRESAALLIATQQIIDETRVDQRFTAGEIRRIHQRRLGEIYEWAGEYRRINIARGAFMFAAAAQVPRLMQDLEHGPLREYTPRGDARSAFFLPRPCSRLKGGRHDCTQGRKGSPHNVAALAARSGGSRRRQDHFPFLEATVAALQAQMVAGTLTSEQLTRAYIKRIGELDQPDRKTGVGYSVNPSHSGQFAARSIKRVSTTPSSCTATRRSDIALARRSSHRATTGLSPRSAIRWSAVAAK